MVTGGTKWGLWQLKYLARHPPKTYYPIGPTSKEQHRFFIINIAFIDRLWPKGDRRRQRPGERVHSDSGRNNLCPAQSWQRFP